jgi:tetratricopeptide (TPR) repeat protein
MWDLAVREADYTAVDAMLRRYQGAPLSMRAVPVYARHDSAGITRLLDEARALDARQSQIAARYVATYLNDPAAAGELAGLDLQPRRNAAIRLGAQTFLAWLHVAGNNWDRARQAFDEAERMSGGEMVRTDRATAATLPFVNVPRADLESIRLGIQRWNPSEPPSGTPTLASALRPHFRLYLLGLLSARLGDDARASSSAREMEQLVPPPQGNSAVEGLVATVRADVALRRGRFAEALRLLDAANGQLPVELVYVKPFVNSREYSQELARYLRAEALLALGRDDEAARWFENSFQGSPMEMVYAIPVRERLAQIRGRRGTAR